MYTTSVLSLHKNRKLHNGIDKKQWWGTSAYLCKCNSKIKHLNKLII